MASRLQASSGVNTGFASSVASAAFGSPLTPGSTIIVWTEYDAGAANSGNAPTDTAGNTYTRLGSVNQAGTFELECWIANNTHSTASNVVTATDTNGGVDSIICVEEWSGIVSASWLDQKALAASGGTPGTALNSGATPTTTNANDVLSVGGVAAISGNHLSLAGSFTNLTQNSTTFSNLGISSQIVSATGAYTGVMTVSSSSSWAIGIVALQQAAAATTQSPSVGIYNPGATWVRRFARVERQLFPWPLVQGPPDSLPGMTLPPWAPGKTWVNRFAKSERHPYMIAPPSSVPYGLGFASDVTTLSDAVVKSVVKNLADSTTLSDAIVKSPSPHFADTSTLSDAIVKSPSPHLSDTTTLSDAIVKAIGPVKSDTTTSTDALVKAFVKALSDSTSLSDFITLNAAFVRGPGDTTTLTDATSNQVGAPNADTTTLSDIISKQLTKILADTTTLSDVATPTDTPSGFNAWVQNLADTTTLTDAAIRQVVKNLQDSTSLSDAITGKSAVKHLGDVTRLIDTITFPGLVGVIVYPHIIVLLDGNLVLQLSATTYLPL